MLMPKRTKYRKAFRGNMRGKASRGNVLAYGEYGLVATEPCWIKSNQIEAARVAMTRYIKRGGHVWIKVFPDKHSLLFPLQHLIISYRSSYVKMHPVSLNSRIKGNIRSLDISKGTCFLGQSTNSTSVS